MEMRPLRGGLDAVLRGFPPVDFQRLKCALSLTVLIGNFLNDLTAA